ncbi:hypothetical protein GW17_00052588 [Ensete ventricosum]|nr:hypothetical protein GW17_00052588 [Ensete ventricosum]
MLQAIIPYIPQLAQKPSSHTQAAPLAPTRATSLPEGQPLAAQPADDLPKPRWSLTMPSGNVVRHPTSTPSASVCSLSDLDTLFSDSIDSLRAQLCMMNQRINDVHEVIKKFKISPSRHSRRALVIGHPGIHGQDQVFPPLLVAHGATLDDCARNIAKGQYVAAEALVAEKREDQKWPQAEPSRGPPPGTERTEQAIPRLPNTPLNSTRTEIFLQIWEKGLLKASNPMKTQSEESDHGCYCHFHRDYGHDTEECYDLKNQIEDLIRRDHLDRW